ncbi:MAG: flagellar filament capping protein FliD [Thiovulaceae bacterium]|nr:flagellar filament capping protein FliD [Sulfurimonadaceae bacterium]
MATGAVSSLGIGSGVLTSSVIDQLKSADTANVITPITNKITANMQKQQDINLLQSLATSFGSSVSSLSSGSLYQNRTVSGSNSDVSVTASSGTDIQNFSISNTKLATSDVIQSSTFADPTATVATGSGNLNLNINGKDYKIPYTASTTYQDLRSAITDAAGADVKASVLQTGDSAYSLVLNSNSTGKNQQITLTDLDGQMNTNLLSGATHIQSASDASFLYNGISITRSSNTITDLSSGVTINLLANDSSGTAANISITQNTQPIKDAMSSMATSYNTMLKQLQTLTNSNTANGAIGDYSGDSTINGIDRGIKNILTSVDPSTGLGLTQYGLNINSDGTLSFDSTAFDTQNAVNPNTLASYFSGGTSVDTKGKSTTSVGVFNTLYSDLNSLTNSTNGTFTNLSTGLTTQAATLQANKTKATDQLNARYATLTSKFIAYDSMISKLNNSFASLSQQISMATNGTTSG